MTLWEQIKTKHEQRRQKDTSANNNAINNNMLYNMLTNDKVSAQSGSLGSGNITDGIGGIAKAVKTFGSTLGASGSGSTSSASPVMGTLTGSAGSGSAISDSINGYVSGTGGTGSAISDSINSSMGSTGKSSGLFSKFKGGGSSGGGVPWAAIASLAKGSYNSISGKDDKDYSDTEEAIIYPLQGAAMGASYSGGNPWAAAGGALYGLGYSFKDDLGMKDSNFLTQMLFPIGMGDGGGLRIGDKSILDLG